MAEQRSKLDCDVHDLLDEANVVLLISTSVSREKATDLIKRLLDCAELAKGVDAFNSEQRLRDAADAIRSRMSPRREENP